MIEEAIVAALNPLFASRVYATNFPEFAAPLQAPMCRFTITAVAPFAALCGDGSGDDDDDEPDDVADWSFQLDVIAADFDACTALRRQVRKALKAIEPPVVCDLWQMVFDTDTKTHRAILNYTAHASSAE